MHSFLHVWLSQAAKLFLPMRVQRPIKRFLDVLREHRLAAQVRKLVAVAELEHPVCAICGSNSVVPHKTRNGFKIVRCTGDGLIFASPRPKDLEPFYDQRYYTGHMVLGYRDYAGHAQQSQAEWISRLATLEQIIGSKGRLFDVGCATGDFLNQARREGWDVSGIELGVWPAKVANEQFGLPVFQGSLPDSRVPNEAFHAVTIFDCIEHVAFPERVLADVRRILRPGGALLISTGALPHEDPKLLSAWYNPPWHLYYFSEATMRALLEKCGFDVLSYSETPDNPEGALMVVLARANC